MHNHKAKKLQAHIKFQQKKHAKLDAKVEALASQPAHCCVELTRLKLQKLQAKTKIAQAEASLKAGGAEIVDFPAQAAESVPKGGLNIICSPNRVEIA